MKKNWCPNDWINWRVGNGYDWFEFDEIDGTTYQLYLKVKWFAD